MECCSSTISSFVNQPVSYIPYSAELQQMYGPLPAVDVIYVNELGQYQQGVFSEVKIVSGNIMVNHGGPATGLILIR